MAEDVSAPGDPFDLERVRALMELMEKHGLTEVNLRRGDEQWRLRRGGSDVPMMHAGAFPPMHAYAPPAGYPHPAPTSPVAPPPGPSAAPAAAEKTAAGTFIKSPTVGTFYSAPTPEDPPFVKVGSKVQPDTVVCLVEAMKVFNQIPAEVSGTILEVLVSNGDSVEFGQPLYRVQPA